MKTIQTVGGAVSAHALGFCQAHEHLLISKGKSFTVNKNILLDDFEKSKQELLAFRKAKGNCVVDAQPVGCNRVEEGLVRLQGECDVYILASTGFHKMIFYDPDHWIFSFSEERLRDVFIHELTEGMYRGCDRTFCAQTLTAKAAQIKTALDVVGLDIQYTKLFSAAAQASLATEAPIMVHVEQGSNPLDVLDFLVQKGVSAKKIVFAHMDKAVPSMDVHKTILQSGAFLEYDTIGRPHNHSDETEVEMMQELLAAGFAGQLLFSLDMTRARMRAYTPEGVGLDYILRVFVPLMKKMGVDDEDIRKISHDNFIAFYGRENE